MNTYFEWDYVRHEYPAEAHLLNNIEDILCRAKTSREDPIRTIQIIQEQLINYCINKGE